jgi:hypothetical protein
MARLASIAIVSEAAHSSDAPEAARPMDWNIFSMLALVATPVSRYCVGRPSICSPAAFLGIRTTRDSGRMVARAAGPASADGAAAPSGRGSLRASTG